MLNTSSSVGCDSGKSSMWFLRGRNKSARVWNASMRLWRRVRLLSMDWAASAVIFEPWTFSWCLIANLVTLCQCSGWHMQGPSHCNPCIVMPDAIQDVWPRLELFSFSSEMIWLCISESDGTNHCLAKWRHGIESQYHTFCCGCIIYVHRGGLYFSIQLSIFVGLKPRGDIVLESHAQIIKCFGTGIHGSLKFLPPFKKWWNL